MKPLGKHIVAEFLGCDTALLNDRPRLEGIIRSGIEKTGLALVGISSHSFEPIGVTVMAIISESHVAIHTYPEARHASIDIFTCSPGSLAPHLLLDFLKQKMVPETVRFNQILRGEQLEVEQPDRMTDSSAGEFQIDYQAERWLYSERSDCQQIDVIENKYFGRMLFLDHELQIAERDAHIYNFNLIYPLTRHPQPIRSVAILGGGDGGALYELLKLNPESVVLVDIDRAVIDVCQKHLPMLSRGAFERSEVEVVIAEAWAYLEQATPFDAIIYDLTAHPEFMTHMTRKHFLKGIFSRIQQCLNPGGIISLQCCSALDIEALNLLKKLLMEHFKNVTFEKAFISSFCDAWVFAAGSK